MLNGPKLKLAASPLPPEEPTATPAELANEPTSSIEKPPVGVFPLNGAGGLVPFVLFQKPKVA
jgi:hypothetical protein